MRMDKLTSRFQQALADAQSLAVGRDHTIIEPAHVLLALLDQAGGGARPLLAQAGANVPVLRMYFHYPERIIGIGPLFHLGDDMAADMAAIREWYRPWMGKHRGTA